jgi:hypothetical protein
VEFTLVTPTRIEGASLDYLSEAKFDCRKCEYSKPKQSSSRGYRNSLPRPKTSECVRSNITANTARQIAHVLEISLAELFRGLR